MAAPLGSIAAFGVVFARRQLRLEAPLLNLRLLRSRPFTAVLASLLLAGVALAGTGLLVTQYLQSVLGYMGLGIAAGAADEAYEGARS